MWTPVYHVELISILRLSCLVVTMAVGCPPIGIRGSGRALCWSPSTQVYCWRGVSGIEMEEEPGCSSVPLHEYIALWVSDWLANPGEKHRPYPCPRWAMMRQKDLQGRGMGIVGRCS